MQVETYECEETNEEAIEQSAEAIALIEELGLDGQRTLLQKGAAPKRCPYRQLTAEEAFIYRTLCPDSTSINKYREGPIPLRVLQVAAHAKQLDVFDSIIIWHQSRVVTKDPFLVATMKNPERTWETDNFILARWGEELDEWPAMLRKGMEKWRSMRREYLERTRGKIADSLAQLDAASIGYAIRTGVEGIES